MSNGWLPRGKGTFREQVISRRSPMVTALIAPALALAFTLQATPKPQACGARCVSPVNSLNRRQLAALGGAAALGINLPGTAANAAAPAVKTVALAGSTGQTGRRVLQRLAANPAYAVIGGVRDVEKAKKKLAESKIEIRGAMVDKVREALPWPCSALWP